MTAAAAQANRRAVSSFRHHILANRRWAAALIALALLLKLVIPTGFMASASNGTLVIEVCASSGPRTIAITIAGLDHQKKSDAGKGDRPCTFAGHGAPLLAAADPIVLAIAIVFIMATVFRVVSRGVADRVAYLRPPLRGPPAAV